MKAEEITLDADTIQEEDGVESEDLYQLPIEELQALSLSQWSVGLL